MKKIGTLLAIVTSFALTLHANISPQDLPSMDNISKLLSSVDRDKLKKSSSNSKKLSCNLPVVDNKRGVTADEISSILAGENKEAKEKIKEAILKARDMFDNILEQNNLAKNDLGVAYSISFVTLWELASKKTLPKEGAVKSVKFFVEAFKGVDKDVYASLSDEQKSLSYDWLMTTPVAFVSLVSGLEQDGKIKEADQIREKSASIFKDLFKISHKIITISDSGEIGVKQESIIKDQNQK